jgi:hypothetical protein
MEALVIGLHRQEYGRSPTVNFGRMPAVYRMSSGNNVRLAGAGKRFRGGKASRRDERHLPSLAPLTGDVQGHGWCSHHWTPWTPVEQALRQIPATALGLYRIRNPQWRGLLYIGQGRIRDRLAAHLLKTREPEHSQGKIFGEPARLECSWAANDKWHGYQRLELENDLIAAHMLHRAKVPSAQFRG